MYDSLPRIRETAPTQQRLHAEEIRIEDRREESLVHDDFDAEAEDVGFVVEVVSEENEPFVAGDCADGADEHGAQAADGFVVCVYEDVAADSLGTEVA